MALSRDLLHRIFVLALLAWVSGVAPLAAQVLERGLESVLVGAYEDPCAGCPDDRPANADCDDAPCSPRCADCPCGPGARVALERDLVGWELSRPEAAVLLVAAMDDGLTPPQHPTPDGLLRPPRA